MQKFAVLVENYSKNITNCVEQYYNEKKTEYMNLKENGNKALENLEKNTKRSKKCASGSSFINLFPTVLCGLGVSFQFYRLFKFIL